MTEKITPAKIHKLLKALSTEQNRVTSQRFFKEPIDTIGVKSADLKPIAREAAFWCKNNGGIVEAINLATPLWKKGKLEERIVALSIILRFKNDFDSTIWKLADEWVDDLKDWACCDYLSADIISAHLDGYPARRKKILSWTKSKNRWRRRAAAVSFVKYARHGMYLDEAFKVAAPLMPDEDDMVRKGVGWLLREAARTAPDRVVQFCKVHEHHAARLILRTASETMDEKHKKELLGKPKR
jgi:3-methyladenine DNA glycosylase AlkD